MNSINHQDHSGRYLDESHTYFLNEIEALRVLNPIMTPMIGEHVLLEGEEHLVLKIVNDVMSRAVKIYL